MPAERSQLASRLAAIDGLVGAVAVDLDLGTVVGLADRGELGDLELAALLDGDLLRHARAVAARAAGGETVRSIVVTIERHHHALVPSRQASDRFLYLVLERRESTFGLLLHRLAELETDGGGEAAAGAAQDAPGDRGALAGALFPAAAGKRNS